jgi:hypothetical protein
MNNEYFSNNSNVWHVGFLFPSVTKHLYPGLGHHIGYPPHKLGLKEWVLYAVSGGGTSAGRTSSAEPNGGI